MTTSQSTKFKQGAASFYIVAISTLILVVIATSFATVIISEITRTSNDDLSQSAYDSALAGVEDAKLALANYERCRLSGATADDRAFAEGRTDCNAIMASFEALTNANNNLLSRCVKVGEILGRPMREFNDGAKEVMIQEATENGNSMNQAYTCVLINQYLTDYKANLTSDNRTKLVRAQFSDGTKASDIASIRLSWYLNRANMPLQFNNFNGNAVTFKPVGEGYATPPTLELRLIQIAENFTLDQLNGPSNGDQTDRATLFLVPSQSSIVTSGNNYYVAGNQITASAVVSTNNRAQVNKPFVVGCGETFSEYRCSVNIELPKPIGGSRSDDTFMFLVTIPYGEPDTEFKMEFCTADGCGTSTTSGNEGSGVVITTQVEIDSTGRANDLFRRIVTRLETSDETFPYNYYAAELSGGLTKDMTVTVEGGAYGGHTSQNAEGGYTDLYK